MRLRIWIALLALYLVWGSTYLAIRFVVESIPPFLAAGVRFLISGTILYVWRRGQGDPALRPQNWMAAAIVGWLLLVGGNGSLAWAEQHVPSGIASLFIGTTPLWMVLLDRLRPKDKGASRLTWLGILLGFTGVALLANPFEQGPASLRLNPLGAAALLFAAFSWAVGSLYSRHAPLPASPLLATGSQMLAGGTGLVLVGTLLGEWGQLEPAAILPRSLGGLVYLITFGSLIGFVAYTWLLRVAPTPLVATYAYVNPVVAILLGAVFGQETITPRVILSAMIILGAVVLINLTKSATSHA